METTKRGKEKRSKEERSKLQSDVNKKIWEKYSNDERSRRGKAISKSKMGKKRGNFSTVPKRSRVCGWSGCAELVYEKITKTGLRKWNKYCCKKHQSLGISKNISITKLKNGSNEERSEYAKYRQEVYRFTNMNDLTTIDGYIKRGKMKHGTDNTNLDHIYSIYDGYINNVPVKIVGNISNLRFIHWLDNRKKGNRSDTTKEELLEATK